MNPNLIVKLLGEHDISQTPEMIIFPLHKLFSKLSTLESLQRNDERIARIVSPAVNRQLVNQDGCLS